jgi:carboxyl-terminal processing protease
MKMGKKASVYQLGMGLIFLFWLLPLMGCEGSLDWHGAWDWENVWCDGDGDPPSANGVWRSTGYGWVVEVSGEEMTIYDITDIHCIEVFTDDIDSLGTVHLNRSGNEMMFMFHGGVTQYDFKRLHGMPAMCQNSNTVLAADDLDNFDILWQTFREHYAFFGPRDVDWDAMRRTYRPQVGTRDLFDIFTDMLTPLRDGHVSLYADGRYFSPGDAELLSRLPDIVEEMTAQPDIEDGEEFFFSIINEHAAIVVENYIDPSTVQTGAENQILWGRLAGHSSLGYLNAFSMAGMCIDCNEQQEVDAADATMATALSQLSDVSTLIVDMRFNLGGYDSVARAIAENLTDMPRVGFMKKAVDGCGYTRTQIISLAGDKPERFTGNVILLISPLTVSAGEVFCLMVKDQAHFVSILGERTWGIYSDTLGKLLPNGWEFTLSNEIYTDAGNQLFETVGVPPDETIAAFTTTDRTNGIDTILDRAIELAGE